MVEMDCQNCSHRWNYTGTKPPRATATCPNCRYKVEIPAIEYHGSVKAEDVDGFDYETGRDFNGDGYIKYETKEAVLPGDVVEVVEGGDHTFYRVVELGRDSLLVYDRDSKDCGLELIGWGSITSKETPHDVFIDENDTPVANIELKKPLDS